MNSRPDAVEIRQTDPGAMLVRPLVEAHLAHSHASSPQTSCHTMTVAELRSEGLQFWAAFKAGQALGCGALKPLGEGLVEVKSVHVAEAARGLGIARRLMEHLLDVARDEGYVAAVLETGSEDLPAYDAARALYERPGFTYCGPIPGYRRDPNSAFMRRDL